METVIVYKRVSVSDNRSIVDALRNGFMVLMAPSRNGHETNLVKGKRIGKSKRRRPKGPAPTAAKRLRNAEIIQLKQKGWGPTAIGKRYGISCARVCQILRTVPAAKAKT